MLIPHGHIIMPHGAQAGKRRIKHRVQDSLACGSRENTRCLHLLLHNHMLTTIIMGGRVVLLHKYQWINAHALVLLDVRCTNIFVSFIGLTLRHHADLLHCGPPSNSGIVRAAYFHYIAQSTAQQKACIHITL